MSLITIVIRTKNEGKMLGGVLQAIRQQSVQDYDVVLVDSGSSDTTIEIARSFGAKIVFLSPASFRYGYALNVGIQNSQAKFAISLSGHATPCDSKWLENLLLEFEDPMVAGTSSIQIPYNPQERSLGRTLVHCIYQIGISKNGVTPRLLFGNASSAFRVNIWRKVQFDNNMLASEDLDWARRVARLGYKITYCQTSQVYHSHSLPLLPKTRKALRELMGFALSYLRP